MPTNFIEDTSTSNTIAYAYNTNYYNNIPIYSNVLNDILTPYDTINLRNTALNSYTNTTSLNSYTSNYISSNVINNVLLPYDTISARNVALGSYLLNTTASSTYATITNLNFKENVLTFNAPLTRTTNTIGIDLTSYSSTTNMNTAISTALNSYTNTTSLNNYTSNYISSNIINNLLLPYDTIALRNTSLLPYDTIALRNTSLLSYTNTTSLNSYTSNYISSNIIVNLLLPYDTIALRNTSLLSYTNTTSLNNYTSNYISSNIINNLLLPYDTIALRNTSLLPYDTIALRNTSLLSYTNTTSLNNYTSNYISSNIINNLFLPYDTIALRNTSLLSYTNTTSLNNYTSNYISSNIVANVLTNYITTASISGKESILTFNTPLTRSVNTISLDLSLYDTITARNTALGNYLPLSGGTMTASITITGSSSGILFNSGSGGALGEAGGTGAYSTSAITNDCILRSRTGNSLILQSGGGASAITINSGNNVSITNSIISTLNVNGIINANYPDIRINPVNGVSLLTVEGRIMGTNGYSGVFGGDMYETAYWGKVVCINGGGLGDNTNATATKITNTSSFSIYTRSSGTSTYFDKNLFVVRNSGNVGIGTTNPQYLLDVNGSANINGVLTILKDNWILSSDGILRIYFQNNGTTFFHSGNTGSDGFHFRNFAQSDIFIINEAGNVSSTGSLTMAGSISCTSITASSGYSYFNGGAYINGLRIIGSDTGNTIYQATGDMGITTNTTNINLGMFAYGTKINITPTTTTINNNLVLASTSMTYQNLTYIYYPSYLYFNATTPNKTITFSSGTINAPVDINIIGNVNLLSTTSYFSLYNKWFIYTGIVNSVSNSLIFNHIDTGINSYWYFNGSQTATNADISDERVKSEIEPLENGIELLMKLKPKKFNILNDKDKRYQYGFISQDIEPEIPDIIYNENHYIANIYDYGNINDKIITMKKNINGLIDVGDELKIILDNDDDNKEYLLNATYEYNLYKKRFVKVINIIDDYTFEVDNTINITENKPDVDAIKADEIFVYGKFVDDFRTLKHNSIISINVKATQELYDIIQELRSRIEILENK